MTHRDHGRRAELLTDGNPMRMGFFQTGRDHGRRFRTIPKPGVASSILAGGTGAKALRYEV